MNAVINNLLTQYTVDGPAEAPLVLMLHGWGASGASFSDLAKHLAKKYRVVRLDFPGFGGTEHPGSDWYIQDYAEFVAAFLAKIDVPAPYCLIGHSFGGRVILKAVGQGIIEPDRIVLMGSAGVKHSANARNQAFKLAAKAGKVALSLPGLGGARAKLRAKLYQAAGSDYLTSGNMRAIFLNTIHEDLQAEAGRIKQPALLVYGQNDTDTPPTDGQILANTIAGSSFTVLANAGHFAYLDAPDRVQPLIDGFLA